MMNAFRSALTFSKYHPFPFGFQNSKSPFSRATARDFIFEDAGVNDRELIADGL